MIRITIQLVSARGRQHDKLLGEVHIANDGKRVVATHGKEADYDVRYIDRGGRNFKNKRITRWRRNDNSTWKLLGQVFNEFT